MLVSNILRFFNRGGVTPPLHRARVIPDERRSSAPLAMTKGIGFVPFVSLWLNATYNTYNKYNTYLIYLTDLIAPIYPVYPTDPTLDMI